jgi:hypothetical protein
MSRALYLEGGIDRANARKSAPQANQKKRGKCSNSKKTYFSFANASANFKNTQAPNLTMVPKGWCLQ